jgi:hypothetical protein
MIGQTHNDNKKDIKNPKRKITDYVITKACRGKFKRYTSQD